MALTLEISTDIVDHNGYFQRRPGEVALRTTEGHGSSQVRNHVNNSRSGRRTLNSESERSLNDEFDTEEMDVVEIDSTSQRSRSSSTLECRISLTQHDIDEAEKIVKMSRANKINRDNAFNINLDVLLKRIVLENDIEKNSAVLADTLETAVNVFSCEVDGLYDDTENEVRIMDDLKAHRRNRNDEVGERREQPRRKKKSRLLEDPSSVFRKGINKNKEEFYVSSKYIKEYVNPMKEITSRFNFNPHTLTYEFDGRAKFCASRKVNVNAFEKIDINDLDLDEGNEIKILPGFNLSFKIQAVPEPLSMIYKYPLTSVDSLEEWCDLEQESIDMESESSDVERESINMERESSDVDRETINMGSELRNMERDSSDYVGESNNVDGDPASDVEDFFGFDVAECYESVLEEIVSNLVSMENEHESESLQVEEETGTESTNNTRKLPVLLSDENEYSFIRKRPLRNSPTNAGEQSNTLNSQTPEKRTKKCTPQKKKHPHSLKYDNIKRFNYIIGSMEPYDHLKLIVHPQLHPYWELYNPDLFFNYSTLGEKELDGLLPEKSESGHEVEKDVGGEESTCVEKDTEPEKSAYLEENAEIDCTFRDEDTELESTYAEEDTEPEKSTYLEESTEIDCTSRDEDTELEESTYAEEDNEPEESSYLEDSYLNQSYESCQNEETPDTSSNMLTGDEMFEVQEIGEDLTLFGKSPIRNTEGSTKIKVSELVDIKEQYADISKLKGQI